MVLETDAHGFLIDVSLWEESWSKQVAIEYGLPFEPVDIQIILLLRQFYIEFNMSPGMRPLVKYLRLKLGDEIGSSIWLMKRYGESPAKSLARVAGLPKPKNCL